MAAITEFRSAVRSGLTRQHKWKVMVNFPAFAGSNDTTRQSSLLARTATTPGSTVGVMEVGWGGRILPIPGDRQYEPFAVTFLSVNDMNVRNSLERWSEAINGSSSNTGLSNLEDFMRDIQFDLLDANDNVVKTYILRDAWPATIAGMDMDAGASDSYAEFNVEFRFISLESNTTR